MKSNITKIQDAIATLDRINGVSFVWKDTNTKSYGVTAQNVERVLPELVNDSGGSLNSELQWFNWCTHCCSARATTFNRFIIR